MSGQALTFLASQARSGTLAPGRSGPGGEQTTKKDGSPPCWTPFRLNAPKHCKIRVNRKNMRFARVLKASPDPLEGSLRLRWASFLVFHCGFGRPMHQNSRESFIFAPKLARELDFCNKTRARALQKGVNFNTKNGHRRPF